MSPLGNASVGAYQISPPWSSPAPLFQNCGQPPNTTATTAAAANHAARTSGSRARTPATASTARPGAIHTQWWSQLIGETRSPVSAHVISPSNVRPARCSSTAAASPSRPTAMPATSHNASPCETAPASRVRKPRSDWLLSTPTNPVRPACQKYACSHHFADACGNAANPATTVTANTPTATAAARNRLVSTRYAMKINGTSLIAAARPTPAPFSRRRSGWHMSQVISTISTSSTWPRNRARCTGSSHRQTPASSSVAPQRVRPAATPSSRNAIHSVPTSAARLTTTAMSATVRSDANDSTANTIAANGV